MGHGSFTVTDYRRSEPREVATLQRTRLVSTVLDRKSSESMVLRRAATSYETILHEWKAGEVEADLKRHSYALGTSSKSSRQQDSRGISRDSVTVNGQIA